MTIEELNILIHNLCDTLIDIIAEDENAEDIILTLRGFGDKRRIQVKDTILTLRGASDKRSVQVDVKVVDEEREKNEEL